MIFINLAIHSVKTFHYQIEFGINIFQNNPELIVFSNNIFLFLRNFLFHIFSITQF